MPTYIHTYDRYDTSSNSYSYNTGAINKSLHLWEEKERMPPGWDKIMWPHPLLLTTDVFVFSAPRGMGCCINYGTTCITNLKDRPSGYRIHPYLTGLTPIRKFETRKKKKKKKDMWSCPLMTTIIRFVFYHVNYVQHISDLTHTINFPPSTRIAKR